MGDTTIEWTDKSWNPVTGCSKVSAGCKFCYAERLFHRPYPGRDFGDVRCHPERLVDPLHWRKPVRIFVNSMSDLFHEAVPDGFLNQVFEVMAKSRHVFQVLTKRPERAMRYLLEVQDDDRDMARWNADDADWPIPNVWLGVSVEDQKTADERIPLLLQTPAAVRFVSYEPALGPVSFVSDAYKNRLQDGLKQARIDWVIAGGESGPNARPSHPDWFRSVRDQCQAAGVPFFFKQWGEWGPETAHTMLYPEEAGKLVAFHDGKEQTYHAYPPEIRGKCAGVLEIMHRVGKKRAGRLLDGREWNEFPGAAEPCGSCGHARAEHFGRDPECRRPDCPCDGYEVQA